MRNKRKCLPKQNDYDDNNDDEEELRKTKVMYVVKGFFCPTMFCVRLKRKRRRGGDFWQF